MKTPAQYSEIYSTTQMMYRDHPLIRKLAQLELQIDSLNGKSLDIKKVVYGQRELVIKHPANVYASSWTEEIGSETNKLIKSLLRRELGRVNCLLKSSKQKRNLVIQEIHESVQRHFLERGFEPLGRTSSNYIRSAIINLADEEKKKIHAERAVIKKLKGA